MTTLAHLSDLHFGTEDPAVVAALHRGLEQIRPDLVIVSGDLTQRARTREFDAASRFVRGLNQTLGCEVLIVPGNHDIPLYNLFARAFYPFRRYRKRFGSIDMAVRELGNLQIILLNSVRRERHASGRISAAQRTAVANLVENTSPTLLNVVVAHHPLGTAPLAGRQVREPQDRRTLDLWREAGVDVILSGHVHRPFLMPVPLRPADDIVHRPLWILNAGTAFSRRTRHDVPNSFNSLRLVDETRRQLIIQRHDFDLSRTRFQASPAQTIDVPARTP